MISVMVMDNDKCNILYREYQDGDEKAIVDLFNNVFKRTFTVDDWHLAFRENPVQRLDIILAFCGDRLVGQSASIPLTYRCKGALVQATRTQNVMVHPDYQGRGIFTQTLKKLTDYIYRQKVDLVVTFPNNNSLPVFIKKLDYHHVDDIYTYQLPIDSLKTPKSEDLTITISESAGFDEDDHEFILKCINRYDIFNFRDVRYLKWRYNIRSKKNYRILRAYQANVLTALVVFKYYSDASGVDLVEFISDSQINIVGELLKKIWDYYSTLNIPVNSYSVWLFPHYSLFDFFIETGFKKTTFSTHVVSKSFSPETANGSEIRTSYYLSMGDSDVY